MVKVKNDLTGKTFGRLKVVKQVEDYISPSGSHSSKWLCECQCENHTLTEVLGVNLTRGNTTSCGCYLHEINTQKGRGIKRNKYDLTGEYGIGWATNTSHEFYFDLEDYDKIKDYCWFENNGGYISTSSPNAPYRKMHQLIKGRFADHINRLRYDNRRENLREANAAENAQNSSLAKNNTSGVIGVNFHKRVGKWNARIYIDKKRIHIGFFNDFEEAVKARLKAEEEYYGEFAPQRHLFEKYGISSLKEGDN